MTIGVLARTTAVVFGDNLNVEIKFRIGGGLVLEDRDPGRAILGAETEVDRSPVTLIFTGSPFASIFDGSTSGVDVVLSRGELVLMLVVLVGIGACQGVFAVGSGVHGNSL